MIDRNDPPTTEEIEIFLKAVDFSLQRFLIIQEGQRS